MNDLPTLSIDLYFDRLAAIKDNLVLAHNEEYLDTEAQVILKAGDEIAVIPPISGG